MGDVYRSADFHETIEFGGYVDMEADTSVGARVVFNPAGMNAVVCFEFTPVGHRRAFELPSGRFAAQVAFFDLAAIVSKAMAVGAVVVVFFEDAETSFGGGGAGGSHGTWGNEQWFRAFHDIDHLVAG